METPIPSNILPIYLELGNYKQNQAVIDTHISTKTNITLDENEYITLDEKEYVIINIAISDLCVLINNLGKALKIRKVFLTGSHIPNEQYCPYNFLIDLFKNAVNISELVQTISKVYEDKFQDDGDYSHVLFAAFKAKDTTAWRYLPIFIDSPLNCTIMDLRDIFTISINDSHLEATIKYLDLIDIKFKRACETIIEGGTMIESIKSNIYTCIISAIKNGCPTMMHLLIQSPIFKKTKFECSYFLTAIRYDKFEYVDEFLELLEDTELVFNSKYNNIIDNFTELSTEGIIYLFDLISSERITMNLFDVDTIIVECCNKNALTMFVYMITYYHCSVSCNTVEDYITLQKRQGNTISNAYNTNKIFLEELDEVIRVNEELMRELD